MAKAEEILPLLGSYLLLFPGSKMSELSLIMYSKALMDYSLPEVEAAISKLVKTCDYFPSVKAICGEIESIRDYVRDNHQLTAAEAWEEVLANAKSVGPYSSEQWQFSAPEVAIALKLFGGRECIYRLESNSIHTARAQFRDIYNGIIARAADRKRTESALKMLGANKAQQLVAQLALTSGME